MKAHVCMVAILANVVSEDMVLADVQRWQRGEKTDEELLTHLRFIAPRLANPLTPEEAVEEADFHGEDGADALQVRAWLGEPRGGDTTARAWAEGLVGDEPAHLVALTPEEWGDVRDVLRQFDAEQAARPRVRALLDRLDAQLLDCEEPNLFGEYQRRPSAADVEAIT